MHPILAPILAKAARAEKIARSEAESLIPLLRSELPDVMAIARIAASASGVEPFTCGNGTANLIVLIRMYAIMKFNVRRLLYFRNRD